MGRDSNFVCKKCEKTYYLGYGSYSTWADNDVKTVKEYDDAVVGECKNLSKNANFRKCLVEHESHDWFTYSSDWCSEMHGNLVLDYNNTIILKDFSLFEEVKLE
jgi:hypothetical protein